RGDARPARPDGDVRPLPRSQIRSDSVEGLLRAVWSVCQLDGAAGAAAVRGAAQDAGLRVVPKGVGKTRARSGRVHPDEGATAARGSADASRGLSARGTRPA